MPSLLDPDLLPSPLVDPLRYPGVAPAHSFLWLDTWVYRIEPLPETGRSGWDVAVDVDGGPLARRGDAGQLGSGQLGSIMQLDGALQLIGATRMAGRYPVLAFGSNASPAQLLAKFQALEPASRVIPVLRGSVTGLALGHSSHVSFPGYVPYVIVDGGAGVALDAFVLWLDPDQRTALDRTEPNYRLVRMPGAQYPLTLETANVIERYSAFKGRWGALRWPGEVSPAPAGTQQAVFGRLAQLPWLSRLLGPGDVRSWMTTLAADAALRDRVKAGFAASGMVVGDGWEELRG